MIIGYRKPNTNQATYLNQVLGQVKLEISRKDFDEKRIAAQKLLFLYHEGIDISWAIFNIIELMGSNSFANKRISYVLASIVLRENEELLTLIPNIFRKDISNIHDENTTSIALTCFSHLCTEDMAQLLYKDT